jgi:tetratricopeptide (TPR) repeat protein
MANIRAAWSWALQHGRLAEIRRSFEAILWLLDASGSQSREKRTLLAQVVDVLRRAEPTQENQLALGLALCCHAFSLIVAGFREAASPLAQEGLSLLRRQATGRVLARGHILAVLGGVAEDEMHAKQFLEQGLTIAQEADGPLEVCVAHFLLGQAALRNGAHKEATGHFTTFLRTAKEIGHRRGEALSLGGLGQVAHLRGQYARARDFYEQSLAILRELGRRDAIAFRLRTLGEVALASGNLEQARARYQEMLSSAEELAIQAHIAWAHCGLGEVALAAGDVLASRRHSRRLIQVAIEDPRVNTSRQALVSLARLVAHQGDPGLAVELVALACYVRPGGWRDDLQGAQALLSELRSGLSPEAYDAAQARGRARDLDATLKELLAEFQDEL